MTERERMIKKVIEYRRESERESESERVRVKNRERDIPGDLCWFAAVL